MNPKPPVTNQPTLHNNVEKRRSEPSGGETLKYISVIKVPSQEITECRKLWLVILRWWFRIDIQRTSILTLFFMFFSSVAPQKLTKYLKRYHTNFNSYAVKIIIHTIPRYLTCGVHNVITKGHYFN
jgi:hypothetical protein